MYLYLLFFLIRIISIGNYAYSHMLMRFVNYWKTKSTTIALIFLVSSVLCL